MTKRLKTYAVAFALMLACFFCCSACAGGGNGSGTDGEKPEEKPQHTHTYSTEWESDATEHWHAATCEHTELKDSKAAHEFGEPCPKPELASSAAPAPASVLPSR